VVWIVLATAGIGLVAALVTLAANTIQLLFTRRSVAEDASASGHESVAAPAETEPAPRGGYLPRRYRPFVNRDAELQEAMSQICDGGEAVLAFEGVRGIGKSAAATELAYRLQQQPACGGTDLREHTFIWVNGHNGCTTLADIGRSLCIETGDQSIAAGSDLVKLDKLRTHLATRKTALVLDNLRLSGDADSENLRELLCTVPEGSLVIAAVNRDDGLDAFSVPLKEFGLEDVCKLIAAQVKRLNLEPAEEFNEAFAQRLYNVVGGHPGTITWFLRAYKRSGQTLDQRLEALQHGQGLDRLFASIWGDLRDGHRALLAACDCLGAKATAAQLAIACDVQPDDARAGAEELLDEGLLGIVRSDDRSSFVCSQAFALFVAGETPLRVRYEYLQRLGRHYVSVLRADPEDARALLTEVDALRAIFEGLSRQHLDGVDDPQLEADLQSLFKATLDVLLTLGLFDDRLAAAQYAYESAMRTQNYRCASLACEVLAGTHAFRGEFDAAEAALAHGWIAAEQSDDTGEIARQMYNEGFLRYRSGKPRVALESVEGAEERALAANDLETFINVLDMRSAAHLYLDELDRCEAAAVRCLEICEAIEWERAKAFPLRFLAEVAIHRGESAEARDLLERAQRFSEQYHDQRQSARVSLTAARMYLLDRELDAAELKAARAASEAQRLGLPPEEEEARALEDAVRLARRSPALLDEYASQRPTRLTDAPVAGD
jgi:hypothetical protein